ncbi:MAG: flagellar type III secretion system pore protein FliP [Pseudomonadales bacterium]
MMVLALASTILRSTSPRGFGLGAFCREGNGSLRSGLARPGLRGLLGVLFIAIGVPAFGAELDLISARPGEGEETVYSLKLQVLAVMTVLTVLPGLLMTTTAFTRVLIVLAVLRQGLGTQQTPSNQILAGMALFLTLFIMGPVVSQAWEQGASPYLEDEIGTEVAFERTVAPFREFMLSQTRESDLALFADLSGGQRFNRPDDIPLTLLIPAFVISELKTAFQIGFLILIPFLVIDLVVASVLMSMGMVMLSPLIISLPFKLMLFVLVDGWALLMSTLAASFVAG